MEHLNRIELRGRVGTVRINEVNGNKVANLSVVTEYISKSRDGNANFETTWFNVTAWNGKEMPELDLIVKGIPIYVSGRMRTTKYISAEGTERIYYEVIANKIRLLNEHQNE